MITGNIPHEPHSDVLDGLLLATSRPLIHVTMYNRPPQHAMGRRPRTAHSSIPFPVMWLMPQERDFSNVSAARESPKPSTRCPQPIVGHPLPILRSTYDPPVTSQSLPFLAFFFSSSLLFFSLPGSACPALNHLALARFVIDFPRPRHSLTLVHLSHSFIST